MRAHHGQREEARRLLAGLLVSHPVADLALPLADTLPSTWPGHMPFRATVWSWFAARPDAPQPVHPHTGGSYQTRWLVIDEHTGTHIDAPRYFVPPPASGLPHAGQARDIGVDSLPLAAMGAADVIDVSGLTPTAAHSALLGPAGGYIGSPPGRQVMDADCNGFRPPGGRGSVS
jgi:Putative cyclase